SRIISLPQHQVLDSACPRTGVRPRSYDVDDWFSGDPVNQALSAANAVLYGVVHAAIVGLGCSPGLGFIHTGHQRAFVYDIADLYKTELTVPVAFDVASETPMNIGAETRRRLRDRLYDSKLLERCARDIQYLLVGQRESDPDALDGRESLALWDGKDGTVAGGVSYEVEF
ncbi:CRISPR-associated endonuclease Cas1, partial [Mycolicibacterium phlei]